MKGKYMIATTAIHKLGDISRTYQKDSVENLCFIHSENDTNYIGNWITGFGFIEVKFPKESTRDLTDSEIDLFNTKYIQLSNYTPQKLNIEKS